MRYPINGTIFVTEPFGTRGTVWTFNRHMGVDLRANFIALYAPADGTITERYVGSKGIQVLSMRIGNQEHRFLHLSRMDVNVGQSVSKGQRIGTTGNSGGVAAHLHWDVRTAGTAWNASFDNYVDPMTLVNKGDNMAKDSLTKAEVIELHNAYFGGNPGKAYDYRHVGGLLQTLISDWKPGTLKPANEALNNTIKIKDNEIKRLEAELALISNDTDNLNKFGEMLRWFVSRIGLNR